MVSDGIKAFLDFAEDCRSRHSAALEGVRPEEKRQCDLEHLIEFEDAYKERCRLSTRFHKCRKARRAHRIRWRKRRRS